MHYNQKEATKMSEGAAAAKSPSALRMSEAELARDLHAVLAKVEQGIEVVIEQDNRSLAVLSAPPVRGRLLSECIALAKARGTSAIPDEGFMQDIADGITERSKPWTPPSWE